MQNGIRDGGLEFKGAPDTCPHRQCRERPSVLTRRRVRGRMRSLSLGNRAISLSTSSAHSVCFELLVQARCLPVREGSISGPIERVRLVWVARYDWAGEPIRGSALVRHTDQHRIYPATPNSALIQHLQSRIICTRIEPKVMQKAQIEIKIWTWMYLLRLWAYIGT